MEQSYCCSLAPARFQAPVSPNMLFCCAVEVSDAVAVEDGSASVVTKLPKNEVDAKEVFVLQDVLEYVGEAKTTLPQVSLKLALSEASSRTFVVELAKSQGTSIGFGLNFRDTGILLITEVTAGSLAAEWNARRTVKQRIRGMDRIVKVNGASGSSSALTEKLKSDENCVLTLMHPREFKVSLDKRGKPLGLTLETRTDNLGLKIKSIAQNGAVTDWNSANPARALAISQRIVEVNGLLAETELLDCVKTSEVLQMRVLSYELPAWQSE
ncbi:unnamed protein product [Polarella glacialis]|uniref:PDZ domain-containing protein n=1 Tax=Polarella glacialis TaxID=89957 RepID=A0A813LGF4_POLGL|nr:unnamed protein product [Polarella glacialis]